MSVNTSALPDEALLQEYVRRGAYTDCYVSVVAGQHSHADFVCAFYTTWLFRLERFILAHLARRPSSDQEARELVNGKRESFAAWRVEARVTDQLLMCDFRDRTRSWFMIEPGAQSGRPQTRLFFGSAVVPLETATAGPPRLGFLVRLLMGFHKLYSRALLRAASVRLLKISRAA